jgi:hypothetical protein
MIVKENSTNYSKNYSLGWFLCRQRASAAFWAICWCSLDAGFFGPSGRNSGVISGTRLIPVASFKAGSGTKAEPGTVMGVPFLPQAFGLNASSPLLTLDYSSAGKRKSEIRIGFPKFCWQKCCFCRNRGLS